MKYYSKISQRSISGNLEDCFRGLRVVAAIIIF
jgi:hypothetical protein